MHLIHLRCFFGRHDWYEIANPPDGYEARTCSRCERRQWRIEADKDKTWINGKLPPVIAKRPPPIPPKGGTGVSPRSIESFQVKVELDPGLWPEEQGKP